MPVLHFIQFTFCLLKCQTRLSPVGCCRWFVTDSDWLSFQYDLVEKNHLNQKSECQTVKVEHFKY